MVWRIENLVGWNFEGYFQVNKEWRDQAREHRDKLKREHPEDVERYDAVHPGMSDMADAICNRKIDFWIKILEYNPDSGLFIAKGKDFFGESGLVGEIVGGEIKFAKIYSGEHPNKVDRFPMVHYEGSIVKPDHTITMGGEYKPPVGYTEKLSGDWRLDSHSKGQDL